MQTIIGQSQSFLMKCAHWRHIRAKIQHASIFHPGDTFSLGASIGPVFKADNDFFTKSRTRVGFPKHTWEEMCLVLSHMESDRMPSKSCPCAIKVASLSQSCNHYLANFKCLCFSKTFGIIPLSCPKLVLYMLPTSPYTKEAFNP